MGVLKDAYEIAKELVQIPAKRKQRKETLRKNQRKDEILTVLETTTRRNAGNMLNPTPGTEHYQLCLELASEGMLKRVSFGGFMLKYR